MKKTTKLIPAFLMLMVSAVMMSTASYAWFSMSKEVTATGMSVTAKADSNLLIASGTAGTAMATDNNYGPSVAQTKTGLLAPVSTVNGINFFTTTDALANGAAVSVSYLEVIDNTPTSGVVGYVDYIFDLKASNTGSTDQTIAITKLNLLYDSNVVTEKAMRVAVFLQKGGETADAAAASFGSSADVIYTLVGAANFSSNQAVASTTSLSAVTYNGTIQNPMTVAAGKNQYYKVTIRLWMEGEDTTCNAAVFNGLNKAWTLDVAFGLNGTAVSKIESVVA